MAEPTNAEVSDERLGEIVSGCEGVTPGPWMARRWSDPQWMVCGPSSEVDSVVITSQGNDEPNAKHIARCDPETICYLATAELNRRSVTSQASEGEVVAWQGDAPDGRRGLTSNSKVAEMWKDVGRTVTPLYASPSKRVERLETAADGPYRRCKGSSVGAAGECLHCDAEQGEACREPLEPAPKPDHVLVKCANGHNNWMERGDRDGWRIQTAYCATCKAQLHRPAEALQGGRS